MSARQPDPPEETACPHLGLATDRRTHYTFPHPAHRCYAGRRPRPPEPGRQSAFCLTDRFATCEAYLAWERRAGLASTPAPTTVPPAVPAPQPTTVPPAVPAPQPTTVPPAVPAPPQVASRMDIVVHVCRPGDTLTRIAAAYGLTVEQIAAANRLALPCTLADAQRLVIPLEPPAPRPAR